MKIDSNTTIEEVKEKTKDSLNGLCGIKNNESDNGKTSKELFDTYRIGRLSTSRKSFSEYDFIRLFLSTLLKKSIIKFDSVNLGYRLIDFYRNSEYSDLFDMPVVNQIEGDYLDLSSCLANAYLGGLISSPIQGTYDRLIMIPDTDEIINGYSEEYKTKMDKLVDDYLLQQEKMINPSGLIIDDVCTDKSKRFAKQFVEKLSNNEFVKDTCPQMGQGFIPTDDIVEEELKKYNELLDSGILDTATKDCRTCQNMSCRVEQNEKPVDGCFGYINHKKEEKGKQLLLKK